MENPQGSYGLLWHHPLPSSPDYEHLGSGRCSGDQRGATVLLTGLPRVRPGSSWLAFRLGSGLGLGLGLVGLDRGHLRPASSYNVIHRTESHAGNSDLLQCYSWDGVWCFECVWVCTLWNCDRLPCRQWNSQDPTILSGPSQCWEPVWVQTC